MDAIMRRHRSGKINTRITELASRIQLIVRYALHQPTHLSLDASGSSVHTA